jgi:hypothetical protein
MILIDHKMRIVFHLLIEHHNWIEDTTVKDDIAATKRTVQHALKPGKFPGGSKEENVGKNFLLV